MKVALSFPNDKTIPRCLVDWQDEPSINGHYAFNFHVCYPSHVKPKQCLWKHATLSIQQKTVLGIVTNVSVDTKYKTNETVVYQFQFESPLALLKQKSHTRSWVKTNPKALFDELLRSQGIQYKIKGQIQLDESLCQYHQTDFEFLTKLCKFSNIQYQFDTHYAYPVLTLGQQPNVDKLIDHFPLLSATVINTDDHEAYQLRHAFGENVRTPLLQHHPSHHWPLQIKQAVYTGYYEGKFHHPFILGRYDVSAEHDSRWNQFISDAKQSLYAYYDRYITVSQPNYENYISLTHKPKNNFAISAKQHSLHFYLKNGLNQISKKSIYQIAYQSNLVAASMSWRANEKIAIKSGKALSIQANRCLLSSQSIELKSQHQLRFQANQVDIKSDVCNVQSTESTKLHADQSIQLITNTLLLGSRTAGIQLSSGGIHVSGVQVVFNAGSVNLFGQWTGVSGPSNWISHLVHVSNAKQCALKTIQIHNLLYIPAEKSFVLLDEHGSDQFEQEEQHWDHLIQSVHESKHPSNAKQVLAKNLEPLVRAPAKMQLCEALSFKGKKWSYVSSQTIGSNIRRYQIDESNQSELITGGKLDFNKLKARFDRLFDGVENFDWSPFKSHEKDAFQWANDWNQQFQSSWWGQYQQLSYHIDSSAQLLRYLLGISYKQTQHLEKLSFSFHATAHVNVDIANACCQVAAYLPSEQGYPLTLSYKDRHAQDIIYHLGAMRIEGHFTLSGYAGCSILANTHLRIKPHHGALQLLGRNFATQDIDVFAGMKIGLALIGELGWYNQDQQTWLPFASTGYEVDVAAGIGLKFGFYVSYEHGKFIIRIKAGLICGAGVEGEIICSVTSKHILEFTKFVYEQLKQHDFAYLYFIEQAAFEHLTHAQMYHIYHVETTGVDMPEIITWWHQFQLKWNVTHHRDVIANQWKEAVAARKDDTYYLFPEARLKLDHILQYAKTSQVGGND